MDNDKEPGYVYILTNPSFRENWVKIGKSARPVNIRSKELDNTAVPLPFEIFATIRTRKYSEVERHVHNMIDRLSDLRIRQHREFFNISPEEALDIFKQVATMIDDAEVVEYVNNKPRRPAPNTASEPAGERKPRRDRFRFSMAKIKPGEMITFDPTGIQVRVASDNQVEYQGRVYKLSPFVGTFMPDDRQNDSGAYQGSKYFSYKGRTLADLRNEYEQIARQETLFPKPAKPQPPEPED